MEMPVDLFSADVIIRLLDECSDAISLSVVAFLDPTSDPVMAGLVKDRLVQCVSVFASHRMEAV